MPGSVPVMPPLPNFSTVGVNSLTFIDSWDVRRRAGRLGSHQTTVRDVYLRTAHLQLLSV